ncbi:MAG: hypothetical protein SGBAC_003717 [Bacillariaceae sp.]
MNHCTSAIQLNDCGLCCLVHHKYEEAAVFFRDALAVIREDVMRQDHQQHFKIPSREEQARLQYECIDLEFYEATQTNQRFRNQTGFNDPVISKTALSIRDDEGGYTNILSALIYNLAITNHLWGLQKGSTEVLEKALRLYEIASSSYVQQGEDTSGPYLSISLSILNNVASIHSVIGNHTEEVKYLHQLLSAMSYCDKSESITTGKSWKACWSNVLTLLMPPPSTASAA